MCHNALFGTGLSVEDRTADRDETESMMHMKQSLSQNTHIQIFKPIIE